MNRPAPAFAGAIVVAGAFVLGSMSACSQHVDVGSTHGETPSSRPDAGDGGLSDVVVSSAPPNDELARPSLRSARRRLRRP
jgi:hypothetical protein